MPRTTRLLRPITLSLWLLLGGWSAAGAVAQPPPETTPNAPAAQPAPAQPTDVNLSELIRSYLALRDQLQAVQLAMLQQRLDAEVASRNQTTAVAEKFEAIRSAIESEREFRRQESQRAQEERDRLSLELSQFQRNILWLAGALAALGLLVAAVRPWLAARRARVANPPPPPAPSEPARAVAVPVAAPAAAPEIVRPPPAPEPVAPPPPEPPANLTPEPQKKAATRFLDHDPLERLRRDPAWIAGLLSQGNSLLMENRSREALSCFEELLQLDPSNSEAWMKRGLALERLQQLESALRSFDQALALEPGLAAAHLYRAGLCTRMRRFDDAAESYRQAARGSAPVNPASR